MKEGFTRNYRDIAPPKTGMLGTGTLKTPLSKSVGKMTLDCEWCGNKFETFACWAKRVNHHFCSTSCSGKFNEIPVEKNCIICGSKFTVYPAIEKRVITCSAKCKSEKTKIKNEKKLWLGRKYKDGHNAE